MGPVYLDYNATTPLDPRVFEAMRRHYIEEVGNAGSRTHVYDQRARKAVDHARVQVAALLGVDAHEVIFTSGATESNNIVVLGLMACGVDRAKKHILVSAIEHKSVLEPLERLRGYGFEIELLPVTSGGFVEPEVILHHLKPDTLLVTIMHANNETGVLQPVLEASQILADSGILFHVDAAQTFGKEVEVIQQLRCDFLSFSAHKVYGPAGVGGLYIRRSGPRRASLAPLMLGGGQEQNLRPGTLPVPLIVGMGEAAEIAGREHHLRNKQAEQVRSQFLTMLAPVDHRINGDLSRMQPHVVNVSFPGVDSEALMLALQNELAISNGAACTSANYTPSHVLAAMNLAEERRASALRFSWGPGVAEIPASGLLDAVRRLRC